MREKTKRQREKETERPYERGRECEAESKQSGASGSEIRSWRLRTHSSRDRAATGGIYASVYAGKRKRKKEGEGEALSLRVR